MNLLTSITAKATAMVEAATVITLASIDENGFPRPAVLSKLKVVDGAIIVSTGTSSAKTSQFKANPKAGVSILEGHNSIIYTGIVEIVEDKAEKASVWSDWMLEHFPGGVEDPEYCVLKFIPQSTTIWIDGVFIKDNLIMNKYCQSCGMPMQTPDQFGTNADGSENTDYCVYCYKEGAFTQDITMDEMIEHCAQFTEEFNKASGLSYSKEDAVAAMKNFFPYLKRWKK